MARLIDSSVFIAMERRGNHLEALVPLAGTEPFALASITASELLVGVERSTSERRQTRRRVFVESVLSQVPIISFDLKIARTHARLYAELAMSGQSIERHDLIIAATALTLGYEVLTYNLRHFKRVPGLVVAKPDL
jgi:tRNA(fMet)-specific endonuclease VapC